MYILIIWCILASLGYLLNIRLAELHSKTQSQTRKYIPNEYGNAKLEITLVFIHRVCIELISRREQNPTYTSKQMTHIYTNHVAT